MSSSGSSRSPSPSPSPPNSATESYHGPPNLERLVTHFVAAKRSLNTTSHVYRANELVTSSRLLIEELAVLSARNAFGRRGLDEQLETLSAIKDALVNDGERVLDEFQAALADLDKAHLRLKNTLDALRQTVVAARTKQLDRSQDAGAASLLETSLPVEEHDDEAPKTLYDFIDDATHETLLQALRDLIDSYHSARLNLDTNLDELDATLRSVTDGLAGQIQDSLVSPLDKPTIYDGPPSTVSEAFHIMESHATQIASLLSNLIEHHDKCVDTLKHTEGGGEAARIAIQSEELVRHPAPGTEESLYGKTAPDPISEEDRAEMLAIVEGDAPQVEDVVAEIKDCANELEDCYSRLTKEVHKTRKQNSALKAVLSLTKSARVAIPGHVDAASTFQEVWKKIQHEMQARTVEVASLSVFYEQFLSGYGKLLREVERRKISEIQMKKIADKARRELHKLYEADSAARQDFMEDVSQYMPSDLGAWHGLEVEPPRWDVILRED